MVLVSDLNDLEVIEEKVARYRLALAEIDLERTLAKDRFFRGWDRMLEALEENNKALNSWKIGQ